MAMSGMVLIDPKEFRCHEDGDQHKIPMEFFHNKLLDPLASTEELPRIFQALAVSRAQGRLPLDLSDPGLLSIDGRYRTFRNGWNGPHHRSMAVAGFYQSPNNHLKAVCAYCKMECKGWQSGEDPIVRHTVLSPNCCLLKCLQYMGPRPRHCDACILVLSRQCHSEA